MATPRKKTTRKKSTRKATSSTRRKSTPAMTSAQKNLLARQRPPWEYIAESGAEQVYTIPWELRGLDRGMTRVPGLGSVGPDVAHLSDFAAPRYSWASYCLSRAGVGRSDPPTSDQTYTLRPDQAEDVAAVTAAYESGLPEFLVANGTGTGKTVTAWAAARALGVSSVLVVCPVAVIPSWRQHIRDMGDDGMDVVVINYESLRTTLAPPPEAVKARKTATQNGHIARKGTPYATFDLVIFDESHKLRNPTSQQSHICSTYADAARFVIRLTATPGTDPAQLHYLHRGLSAVTGDPVGDTLADYTRWCSRHGITLIDAPFGNGVAFGGDRSQIELMERIVYGDDPKWATRRRMDDRVVRAPLPLTLSSSDAEAYRLLVADARDEILEGRSARRADRSKGLAAVTRLRQKTGILKAPHVVEYTRYCLDDLDEQVVISTVYHHTADTLSELLDAEGVGHAVLTGRDDPETKEALRLSFQRGEVPVLITSLTTGVSLHASEAASGATDNTRRLVVADLSYSPTEHIQVEGRINRDGQHGVVAIPYLAGTADHAVTTTLLRGLSGHAVLQDTGEADEIALLATALGL